MSQLLLLVIVIVGFVGIVLYQEINNPKNLGLLHRMIKDIEEFKRDESEKKS